MPNCATTGFAAEGGASAKNVTSPYDGTALIAAAHLGHVEVVRVLGGELDDLPTPWEEEYLARARAGKMYGGNAVSFLNSF